MAYIGKTNWQNNEIVEASDMNRIEQGILDVDADLSSHTHGNITNDGKIGSTADQFILTGSGGALTAVATATAIVKLGAASKTGADSQYFNIGQDIAGGEAVRLENESNTPGLLAIKLPGGASYGSIKAASATFTGTPTAPTPTAGDNSTKIATTAFVKNAIDNISSGDVEVGYTEYTALDGGQGVTNIDLTNSHAYVFLFYEFEGNFSINISAIPDGKKRYLYMYTTTNINVAISKPSYLIYRGDEIPASLSLFSTLVCFEITRMPGSSDIVAVKKVTY